MEVVQVQPRDFYLHYIYVPTKGTAIRWSFTTSKNNIAFGLYQRLGQTPLPSSSDIVLKAHQSREQLKPYALTKKTEDETSSVNSSATTQTRPRSKSVASEKLKEREDWVELVPIEYVNSVKTKVEGSYTVQEPGNYILVFDNTFSKNTPKVVTFSVALIDPKMEQALEETSKAEMSGWLLKKRRKKLQGWAKRWFELSKGGVLSYSTRPDSLSRGSIQLLLATISTNPEQHMIHIDSGSTLFHLKCQSAEEYEKWTKALRAYRDDESLYQHDGSSSANSLNNKLRRSSIQRNAGGCMSDKITSSQQLMHLAPSNSSFVTAATTTDYQHADRLWSQIDMGISNAELLHSNISSMDEKGTEQNKIESLAAEQIRLWKDVQISMQRLFHRNTSSISSRSRSKLKSSTDLTTGADNEYQDDQTLKVPKRDSDANSFASSEFYDAESVVLSAYDEDFNQENISDNDSSSSSTSSSSSSEEEVDSILQGNKNARQTHLLELISQPNNFHRRQILPSPAVNDGVSALSVFRKNIGKDLSQIAMPVSMNEPLSMLQKACEDLEYSELLDKAAQCENSIERLMYVATFAISTYSSSQWRSGRKPFNPMMSETYECIRPDKGFRFVSEKVSHHPLIIAAHSQAKNYQYWQCTKIKSKFWGKSMEFMTEGTFHIVLQNSSAGNEEQDHYTFTKPSSWMRNMIAGEKYLEHVGEMNIKNHTTGEYGVITFKEGTGGGLFSAPKNRNNVTGVFYSADGKKQKKIIGKWSEAMAEDVNMDGRTLSVLWKAQPPANLETCKKYYGFSPFAIELNEITPIEKDKLPKTDTRFRPDQRLYEEGKVEAADEEKLRIEKMQRATRASFAEKGQSWNPRWFTLQKDQFEDPSFYSLDEQPPETNKVGYSWKFNGDYWKVRETGKWPSDAPDLW